MNQFLMGTTAMACWVAALFFLRFWRDTRDRLFGLFAAAFVLLGFTRVGLAFWQEQADAPSYFHWVRLAAFLLILLAIIDKNRR